MIKNSIINNISELQDEYYNLLRDYEKLINNDKLRIEGIAGLIDELDIFWLKHLEKVRYELEILTENTQCFLLAGALYLNIEQYEHFYFKSFGESHVVSDPLLKMESFIRADESYIDNHDIINKFRGAYKDTFNLLGKFKNEFFVFPVSKLYWKENEKENYNILNDFFWQFISEIFQKEINRNEEFCDTYDSFDEIEENLNEFVLNNLIFRNSYDANMSLKERVCRYQKSETSLLALTKDMNEPEIFLLITRNYISQALDILLACVSTGLNPYIRFEVTFRYMLLIMDTFLKDKEIKEMLKKTILFYVFQEAIDVSTFRDIDFKLYCYKLHDEHLLNTILGKIDEKKINVFDCKLEELVEIIKNEFDNFLNCLK